ncbi:hypothetical protein [Variovorax sp.]|uniref:hypothetical protein n=2 Tax=unclassified Variovorax TaxID=663243 RepID=UPI003BAD95B0
MNSPWHRDTHGASQALRFGGPLPTAAATGQAQRRSMQARWNRAPAARTARQGWHRSAWMPRLAGLLAFGALVAGMLVAGSETCTAQEHDEAGSYARSTLATITEPGTSTASARRHAGACRHARKAGRLAHPKPAP